MCFVKNLCESSKFFFTADTGSKGNRIYSGNSTILVVISLVFGGVILAMTITIVVGKLKKRMSHKGSEVVKDI